MGNEPFHHVPVLLDEVLELLPPGPGLLYADGTLGGAGHALAMVERGCALVGCDQDLSALAAARERLAPWGERVELHHARFSALAGLLGERRADLVLLDLGVSSPQLDRPERGFSFRADGPLDFRMDPSRGAPLSERLDELDEAGLADVLWRYGEERLSRPVARAILAARPLRGTLHLAEVIARVVRPSGGVHPATRSFQGLRIWINDELGELASALDALPGVLAPGGRFGVISFHSLEDRMVKRAFAALAGEGAPTDLYGRPLSPPRFRLVARGGRTGSPDNPRARSARLRVLERLP